MLLRHSLAPRTFPRLRCVTRVDHRISDYPIRARYATVSTANAKGLSKSTRNIGIIAHIDAGKTTTTERMLYYSGYTRRIGNVDDGSTITDFLPAERARGITIQSAAITFHWPPLPEPGDHGGGMKVVAKGKPDPSSHTINLIDTPGHADFTFEVLRSLRILDGAVCILDGVAGVEAQTEKVWYQAQTYNIPKIIYVNKLDREGAAFGRTVKEIAAKMHVYPAVCQIPWFAGGRGEFCGVVDVVNLRAMRWEGGDGKRIGSQTLTDLDDVEPKLAEQARKARIALVELLSEFDDQMVDAFLNANEDHLAVSSADITASLRKVLLSSDPVVPVFAGASFRNIGVQPLIDAVTDLLPTPEETPDPQFTAGSAAGGLQELINGKVALTKDTGSDPKKAKTKKASNADPAKLEACALAFKVASDPKRKDPLVYIRVYQGSLNKGSLLYNTNLQVSERAPRLFRMYADNQIEIESIEAGQIGVVTGLKYARTGDTLVTYSGMNPSTGPPAPLNELQLRPIEVPPPVFFASIEPDTLAEQKPTEEALKLLLREDPSLHLSIDEESGQTLLSGMGELHLEIARDRLINDLKAKCSVGKIAISFRECLNVDSGEERHLYEREIAGRAVKAGCTARVEPTAQEEFVAEGTRMTAVSREDNTVTVDVIQSQVGEDAEGGPEKVEKVSLKSGLSILEIEQALKNGALAGLARGPRLAVPMSGVHVSLTFDLSKDAFGSHTTAGALSQAARLAVQAALRKSHEKSPTGLMEPVMNVFITVNEESLGDVMHDLTAARGGHISSLDEDEEASQLQQVGGASAEQAQQQQQAKRQEQSGTSLSPIDLKRVYAPPDPWDAGAVMPFEETVWRPSGNRPRTITAKVPLREMVGYLKHLRSLTKGRGTFVMSVDKFEKMSASTEKAVMRELRGGF